MSAIIWGQASARTAVDRIATPRALFAAAGGVLFALLAALAEWRADLMGAASRALKGSTFGLVVPLLVFGAVGCVVAPGRPDEAAMPLARLGAPRRSVAAAQLVTAMVAGAVVAAFVATLVAVVAHDPTAPPRARDAIASAWIGGLTACAYASLFFAGATVGVRGGGRWAALIFDFALGSTTGPFALLCPRAHAINLLGGEPVMMLSQTSSAGVLVLLSIGFGAIAIARTAP